MFRTMAHLRKRFRIWQFRIKRNFRTMADLREQFRIQQWRI
jgi:hypothetical protein